MINDSLTVEDMLGICRQDLRYVETLLGININLLTAESIASKAMSIVEIFKVIFKFILNLLKTIVKLLNRIFNKGGTESQSSGGGGSGSIINEIKAHGKLAEVHVAAVKNKQAIKQMEAKYDAGFNDIIARKKAEEITLGKDLKVMRELIEKAIERVDNVMAMPEAHDVYMKTNAVYKRTFDMYGKDIFLDKLIPDMYKSLYDPNSIIYATKDLLSIMNKDDITVFGKPTPVPYTILDTNTLKKIFGVIDSIVIGDKTHQQTIDNALSNAFKEIRNDLYSVMTTEAINKVIPLTRAGMLASHVKAIDRKSVAADIFKYLRFEDTKLHLDTYMATERLLINGGISRYKAYIDMGRDAISKSKINSTNGRDFFIQIRDVMRIINDKYKEYESLSSRLGSNTIPDQTGQMTELAQLKIDTLTMSMNIFIIQLEALNYLSTTAPMDLTKDAVIIDATALYAFWQHILDNKEITVIIEKAKALAK